MTAPLSKKASALVLVLVLLLDGMGTAIIGTAQAGVDEDVWSATYDATTQTRYIPMELILGAPWNGRKELALPAGRFTESVARDPSTWSGPLAWLHPDLNKSTMVYERSRKGVAQRFAVRDDGSAVGRVSDSRFGISSCDQEAKYPLGYWKQGETREFAYRCWIEREGVRTPQEAQSTIHIEQLDFVYAGQPHALQIRWIFRTGKELRETDNRVYTFAPGKGVVLLGR